MTLQMIPSILVGVPLLALIGAVLLRCAWEIIKNLLDEILFYRDWHTDKAKLDSLERQGYGRGIIWSDREEGNDSYPNYSGVVNRYRDSERGSGIS